MLICIVAIYLRIKSSESIGKGAKIYTQSDEVVEHNDILATSSLPEAKHLPTMFSRTV